MHTAAETRREGRKYVFSEQMLLRVITRAAASGWCEMNACSACCFVPLNHKLSRHFLCKPPPGGSKIDSVTARLILGPIKPGWRHLLLAVTQSNLLEDVLVGQRVVRHTRKIRLCPLITP